MGLVKLEKHVGDRVQLGMKMRCLMVKMATFFLQIINIPNSSFQSVITSLKEAFIETMIYR